MTCNPSKIIKAARGESYVVNPNGGTLDIVQAIIAADKKADQYIDQKAVKCLLGENKYETLNNVWRFVKNNLTYRADRPGYEVVKSPGALFDKGRGDCKSYSIATAAILRALGFTGIRYRFVSYKKGDYTHVYVVCKLSGKDVILDAVYTGFDREAAYTRKQDIPASGPVAVSGIGQPAAVNGDIQKYINIAIFVSISSMAYYLLKK